MITSLPGATPMKPGSAVSSAPLDHVIMFCILIMYPGKRLVWHRITLETVFSPEYITPRHNQNDI